MSSNDPLLQALGVQRSSVPLPTQQQAEDDPGFLESTLAGFGTGVLEPLGFIDPVERRLRQIREHRGEGLGDSIGYTLGYLGGWLVPATPALKVGGYAARGLGLVASSGGLRTAGQFVRGSIAGGILGAGREAEDPRERLQHIALEGALFGVGDAAAHVAIRALEGTKMFQSIRAGLADRSNKLAKEMADVASDNTIKNSTQSVEVARAVTLIDEIIKPNADEPWNVQKLRAQLGVEPKLAEVRPGEIKTIPSFEGDTKALDELFDSMDGVFHRSVTRELDDGRKIHDVLVSRDEIGDDLVEAYQAAGGVIPGQMGVRSGKKYVIDKVSAKGNHFLARQVGSSSGKRVPVPRDQMLLLNYIRPGHGGKLPEGDAVKLWREFVDEYSEFPNKRKPFKASELIDNIAGVELVPAGHYKGEPGSWMMGPKQAQIANTKAVEMAQEGWRGVIHRNTRGEGGWSFTTFKNDKGQTHELFPSFLKAWNRTRSGWSPVNARFHGRFSALSEVMEEGDMYELLTHITEGATNLADDVLQKYVGVGMGELQGFRSAFSEFAEKKGLPADQMDRLESFFAKQQQEVLREVAPEALEALQRINERAMTAAGKTTHPAGELFEKASERGYFLEQVPLRETADGRYEWGWSLKSHENGNRINFKNKSDAAKFLDEARIDMDDMPGTDVPLASGVGGDGVGVGAQHAFNAGDLSNLRAPWWLAAISKVGPRYAAIREISDWFARELGTESSPHLFEVVSKVQLGRTRMQNAVFEKTQELLKLRGGRKPIPKNLRPEAFDDFMELVTTERKDWNSAIKRLDLTPDEVKVAHKYRDFLGGTIKDLESVGVTVDEDLFVEALSPFVRLRPEKEWVDAFKKAGVEPDVIDWLKEVSRKGMVPTHERDPFRHALGWVRAVQHQVHTRKPLHDAFNLLGEIPRGPETGTGSELARRMLSEYLEEVASPGPERYWVTRIMAEDITGKLNIQLHPRDMDRFAHALMSLNYGAFMGFRPGLAVRNMTQLLVATLPMVGPRDLAVGIRYALQKGKHLDELYETGTIQQGFTPVHGAEDLVFNQNAVDGFSLVHAGRKATRIAENIKDSSMYLYRQADEFNRAASYFAMKSRTQRAYRDWKMPGSGHMDKAKFDRESGLTMLGESITREFHNILASQGDEAAFKWIGSQMSNETQWVYQLGAGPSLFSHGVGKVFGMYGTWPSWMTVHLRRGLSRMDKKDVAKFTAWTMAVHAAFITSPHTTGITDFSRWSGLSSLRWMGGPGWDWFKNFSDIWTGITNSGEPTAGRQVALAQMGLKHVDRPVPLVPDIGIRDPARLFMGTIGMLTPGAYALKDISDAVKAPDPIRGGLELMGMPTITVGRSWPEINVSP